MKRKTLMEKIFAFEAGTETVESFNIIFANCPILGYNKDDIVTIGECVTPETTRVVTVNGTSFNHNFVPVVSEKFDEELLNEIG